MTDGRSPIARISHIETSRYTSFSFENFQHTLQAIQGMLDTFARHPAVTAIQHINEPFAGTPLHAYQLFTWTVYNMVSVV